MKSLVLLILSATVLAQLEAIPSCAQKCFTAAISKTPCIFEGVLDPTCVCTSYSLSLSNGGHETGIDYAYQLCGEIEEACDGKDADAMETAFNNLCYNSDNSPKYNCGIIPGSPVPTTASVSPTGSVVETWDDGYLATMPVYPDYTTILVTSMVYKHTTFTETYAYTTSTIVTDYPLYPAVCPVRATVGVPISHTLAQSFIAYTTSTRNLYDELTSAAASVSRASVAAAASASASAQVTTSSSTLSTSVSSSGATITGAANGTSASTGTRSGSAPASTVSKAGAEKLKDGLRCGAVGVFVVGLMGFMC
ncbi:hypothetical protein EG329_013327 [Mollisiaceae sp. DMI_Dod_QoI]|nr:hypothetical protein EG329_013327 [Helotiales sp. DMI_Dod_QoI]